MNPTFELLTRILCDTRPEGAADGAYLFCTTIDNQASVFQAAGRLVRHFAASRIFILDGPAMSGYPGAIHCRERLRKRGLPAEQIDCVPYGNAPSINTLTESQALLRFARDRKLGSLVVVSTPFHQLRAFMTSVTVALEWYPELRIYSCPGEPLSWLDPVVHSQGTLKAQRRQLIHEELARIDTYQKKGDLASFDDVLAYLDRRDA